jgi:hypothetical protein
VVAFAPSVAAGFLADDYVLLGALGRATSLGWAFQHNDLGEAGGAGHFYRPVWLLWNKGLFELSREPVVFHVGNLFLYTIITLEVLFLALRLMPEPRAWISAVAFAVYPRHGESVAWISGSTDLLCVAFGLGALIALASGLPARGRVPFVLTLTGLAALSKEIAYVLPALALLVLLAPAGRSRAKFTRVLVLPAAMAAVVVAAAVVRILVIGGVGGYQEYPWTLPRVAAVVVSYALASVTPPDLQLLRAPWLLVLPALVFALVLWRMVALWHARERRLLQTVAFGLLWAAVSLLPILNLAIDLNNGNGERLMLLASVGLAFALAALLPAPSTPVRITGLAALAFLALALSFSASFDWIHATEMSNRVIREATAFAPPRGEVMLLSGPENYRTAHVFTTGDFTPALEDRGLQGVTGSICTQVVVRRENPHQIAFTSSAGSYWGRTTWDAPFDFPAFSEATALSVSCPYRREAHGTWPIGLGLATVITPLVGAQRRVIAFFDGHDLRICC